MNYDSEEHPEASPWASSPQHSKTSFGAASESDVSTPPVPQSPFASYTSPPRHGEHEESPYQPEAHSPPAAHEAESDHGLPEEHHSEVVAPQADQQRSQSPTPAPQRRGQRYHQQARRPQPQYKLQAKVTALERTGKKDPILRFDVYVSAILFTAAY